MKGNKYMKIRNTIPEKGNKFYNTVSNGRLFFMYKRKTCASW